MNAEGPHSFFGEQSHPIGDCTLPLFPLDLWLYPTVTLPLQIFEPRYLSMVSESLKKGSGFGIVPIEKGSEVGKPPSIFPFGVEVSVVDWYQQENGLLGIQVRGLQRFRVLQTTCSDEQLLKGEIEYLPLELDEPILERHNGLLDLLVELKQHPHAEALAMPEPISVQELSYQLAQLLPFSATIKTDLFQADTPEDRLALITQQVFELANA